MIVTKEQLIATDAISAGRLCDYYESPRLYHGRYVTGEIPRKPTSQEMIKGNVIEDFLRTGEVRVHLIPPEVLSASGARAGKAWKEWSYDKDLERYLSPKEYAEVVTPLEKIRESVMQHRDARELIECAHHWDAGLVWDDEMKCKTQVDLASYINGVEYCVNIKTSSEVHPDRFSRSVQDLSIHLRSAHEVAAYGAVWGPCEFRLLCIQNKPPYDVEVYQIDDWIQAGQDIRKHLLRSIRQSTEDNRWTPEQYGKTVSLKCPSWVCATEE